MEGTYTIYLIKQLPAKKYPVPISAYPGYF